MAAQLNPVSPITGKMLGRLIVTSGGTCGVDKQNQVDPSAGPLTVKLPTSYDDDTVVMVENNSTTDNTITVDGNGQNIDGVTTFSFSAKRAVVSFGRNAASGEWTKLVTQRLLDGASELITLKTDLAVLGLDGAAEDSRLVDLAEMGGDFGAAWPAQFGGITVGLAFIAQRALTCTGIKMYVNDLVTGGPEVSVSIWKFSVPGAPIVTKNFGPLVNGGVRTLLFDAAVSLPQAITGSDPYVIGVRNLTDPQQYPLINGVTGTNVCPQQWLEKIGSVWMLGPYRTTGAFAMPSASTPALLYPITPILQRV